MENWTNEELISQIITKANHVSIISESNDLTEMRDELLRRLYSDVTCPACGTNIIIKYR